MQPKSDPTLVRPKMLRRWIAKRGLFIGTLKWAYYGTLAWIKEERLQRLYRRGRLRLEIGVDRVKVLILKDGRWEESNGS